MNKKKIIKFKSIDSTNRYGLDEFANLADKTLVVAEHQSSGRGRRGKSWISPKGVNVYASYIVKNISFPVYYASWIASLAVLDAVNQYSNNKQLFSPWIKWPNDIFCENRKISGTLCEVKTGKGNQIAGVVMGVGININMNANDLNKIDQPATSLMIECNNKIDIDEFVSVLYQSLNKFHALIINSGTETLYKLWKKENLLIGKEVNIKRDNNECDSGIVLDINQDGNLVVNINNQTEILHSGDISIKPV